MIDRERLVDSTHIPTGYGTPKDSTGDPQAGSSISPPIYEGVATDPLYRRVLVSVVGTIALAIWIIAWSVIGLVEGHIHTKINLSFVTFFSLVTLAFRVPVLIAVLFKKPNDAVQKFDAYLLQRRALVAQHILAILWANLTIWPAVAMASAKHAHWLDIAMTVLCADMTFLLLMSSIASRRIATGRILLH